MTKFSRATVALVALAGVACQNRLDDPESPDTSAVEAHYDQPPGMFSASDLTLLKANFERRLELLKTTGNFAVADGMLNGASANSAVVEHGDEIDPSMGSRLLAVVKVNHICRGPQGEDALDPDLFGTVKMTIKGSLRGVFPTAWGEFDACSDHTSVGAFTIDGPYAITVRKRDTGRDVLFIFQGTITSGLLNFNGELDVRVRSNGTPEIRLTGTQGDVVLSVDPTNGKILAHDRTGVWSCDPIARECVNLTTGERKTHE